jgi:hypothetical protein
MEEGIEEEGIEMVDMSGVVDSSLWDECEDMSGMDMPSLCRIKMTV